MIHKKFYLFLLLGIFFSHSNNSEQEQLLEIAAKHTSAVDMFKQMMMQNKSTQVFMAPQFFLQMDMPFYGKMKELRKDLKKIDKEIKFFKQNQKMKELQIAKVLKKDLSDVLRYIKRHKLQYDIAYMHQALYKRWQALFSAIAKEAEIKDLLVQAQIVETGFDGLRMLARLAEKDLKKVENYEYRLHSDWIDLKLANYVLKIELIRLRNAALFHPLYKHTNLKLSSSYPR